MSSKELEVKNSLVLHNLGEMMDTEPRMSLSINNHLNENGLEIPANSHHNASATMSRTRSRMSMRSSGRASECSLTVHSGDGTLSRRMLHLHLLNHLWYEI